MHNTVYHPYFCNERHYNTQINGLLSAIPGKHFTALVNSSMDDVD